GTASPRRWCRPWRERARAPPWGRRVPSCDVLSRRSLRGDRILFAALVQRREQRGGGDKLQLVHAADAAQRVTQLLEAEGRPLDQQHLERLVVLEKHVLRGDDLLEVVDLGLGQLLADAAAVAAVDQRDRAGEHV